MDEVNLNELVNKNQSIKIVPSVEDTFRAIGLDVDIDDRTQLWFDQLKITWKTWKRSAAVENQIETFLRSSPDPYRLVLVFVIKGEDYKDCKPKSLSYFIVEIVMKLSQSQHTYPEESLKMPAFRIAIQQRNQHFLSLIVKAYQLITIKQDIMPIITDMIRNDNCKMASQIVIAMDLFEDIPVEDLMFPLILQDKNNMIDEYLSECPSQVKPLLLFLDKLLDKKFNLREYVSQYIEENKICRVKYEKLHYKPLGKLVARLCNKFNIPIETCKNLSKNRTTGGLRYLIHQKYVEHNVSLSVWDDLVKDSLRQNAGSVSEFIDILLDYDRNEAVKWATYFNVPENLLPSALKDCSLQEFPEEENWEAEDIDIKSQKYYTSSLPREKIIMIDTGEKFYDLMISNLVKCSVVSIDCEWKPSFGATQSQVALIQVATDDYIYLIDALTLNKQQYASFWYSFHKSLLENAEIIKVGFGLEQDLKEIKASVVGLGNMKVKGEGLLDLCTLWKSLINSGLNLPGSSENGGQSLSSLVQACFGLPLEKSEQCSNWELRPLRDSQIQYAALDAHILIQIYYYLQKQCLQQGINFEEVINDVMIESKKKCTNKKPKALERIHFNIPIFQSKPASEAKFIVEAMLSNLISYLRYCGIDTIVAPSTMLWHDVINLAIAEERLIILSKLKCSPTATFPQNSILDVGKGNQIEQLYKIINTYNINIQKQHLLNVCILCNSKELKKLNPDEVTRLCLDYQETVTQDQSTIKAGCDYDDEDPVYENFLSDSDCDDDIQYPTPNSTSNTCLTQKGATIQIDNVQDLSALCKPAILCEECGKLYWDGDRTLQSISETVFKVIKLKLW